MKNTDVFVLSSMPNLVFITKLSGQAVLFGTLGSMSQTDACRDCRDARGEQDKERVCWGRRAGLWGGVWGWRLGCRVAIDVVNV